MPSRPWVKNTISVMHFNCLCRHYEPQHIAEAAFEKRKQLIIEQVNKHYCDVIALQEANPSSWYRNTFGDEFHMGFVAKDDSRLIASHDQDCSPLQGFSHQRLLSNVDDHSDGHFLMVRKNSAVELVEFAHIPIYDTNCEDPQLAPLPHTVARQNVLAAVCYHRVTGQHFLVCGSHMKANEMHKKNDTKRIGEIRQMIAGIQRLRSGFAPQHLPVIFMGDFNADLWSESTKFLLTGRAEANGIPQHLNLTDGRILWDSVVHDAIRRQKTDERERRRPVSPAAAQQSNLLEDQDFFTILVSDHEPVTSWQSLLDYILYERGRFALVSFLSIPTRQMRKASTGAPAAIGEQQSASDVKVIDSEGWGKDAITHVGSDHVPLAAEFLLLPTPGVAGMETSGSGSLFTGL